MTEMEEVKKVRDLLTKWILEIQSEGSVSYFDINRVSENLALRLLNAMYDYDLDNRNWEEVNYPGIDLGCLTSKIAFQVTSQTSWDKIKKNVQTFFDEKEDYAKTYSQGIRFLLLDYKKPPIAEQKKRKFWEQFPKFDLEKHIISISQVTKFIERCYSKDRSRFDKIKQILEEEYGAGVKTISRNRLLKKLFRGSKCYHDDLRGKTGRFRHLDISEIILSPTKQSQGFIDTPVELDDEGIDSNEVNNQSVLEAVPRLWKEEYKHAMLVGEGGMGKTVSILRLWKYLLGDNTFNPKEPVPIFIPLNEFNETISDQEQKDFIINKIRKHYLEAEDKKLELSDILIRSLENKTQDAPSLILLLDGFNEVTIDKTQLLLELREIIERWKGVQVIISSRLDMRDTMNWSDFHLIKLLGLNEEAIHRYLGKQEILLSKDGQTGNQRRLLDLLKNPMMLTIYASTCEAQDAYKNNSNYEFKTNVESPGELLWNFIETQVVKSFTSLGLKDKDKWLHRFLLKHLLPAIGHQMESKGRFEYDYQTLASTIDSFLSNLSKDDFFCTFPSYAIQEDHLPIQDPEDQLSHKQKAELITKLSENLLMLIKEGTTYRFLHQNFRDFFAAVHILNETQTALSKSELPASLTDQTISFYPRQYIGEIEGAHHSKPHLEPGIGWKSKDNSNTILAQCLEKCRNTFDGTTQLAIWNILDIWKQVRGEWTGLNLSQIDLSKVTINGVNCSWKSNNNYLATSFEKSLIHNNNIFPQGHTTIVKSAVYSPDGKKILSVSFDKTIKEWDATTGECIRTLSGHHKSIMSAVYNPGGEKVLSTSEDHTIKEWDLLSGNIIKTFYGHKATVHSAVYNSNGKKVLSSSKDGTIKEWDIKTGTCIKTFFGHNGIVFSAVYSPDEKKILSASSDLTIKEWSISKAVCLRTLKGHTKFVKSAIYSPKGEKILSASDDKTVKEWKPDSNKCLRTLIGHDWTVSNAVYSLDGKKILSSSGDHSIKEWDAITGECIRTFKGAHGGITSVAYSPNCKKILAASIDKSIREWDIVTGECSLILAGHEWGVIDIAYSSNKRKALSSSFDGTAKEWDTIKGKCIQILKGHSRTVTSVAYSPCEKKVLSASWDRTIKEWDVCTGKCIQTLIGQDIMIAGVSYSDDGKKIISTLADHRIKVWFLKKESYIENRSKAARGIDISPPKKITTDYISIEAAEVLEPKKIPNIPGLWIQGCSFADLHPGSDLSEDDKEILRMYGAEGI